MNGQWMDRRVQGWVGWWMDGWIYVCICAWVVDGCRSGGEKVVDGGWMVD